MTRTTGDGQRRFWPLGPWPLVLLVAGVLAVGVPETTKLAYWNYLTWPAVGSAVMFQTALMAPIVGGFATYYAGRIGAPSRLFANRSARRAASKVVGRDVGLLVTLAWSAYLLGVVPLLVLGLRRATAGGFDWFTLATGCTYLAASVLFGYVVGLLGRSALWVLVTVFGLYYFSVALAAGNTGLSPVTSIELDAGQSYSPPLMSYRLVWLVVVALACWLFAVELRDRLSRVPSVLTAGLLILCLMGALVPVWWPARVSAYDPRPQMHCSLVEQIEYCVHDGHTKQLAQLIQGTNKVLDAYGFAPARLQKVYDDALYGLKTQDRDQIAWVRMMPENPIDEGAANEIAFFLSSKECPDKITESSTMGSAVEALLIGPWPVIIEDGRQPFAGMSTTQIREWIRAHDAQIAGCSLKRDDFPKGTK